MYSVLTSEQARTQRPTSRTKENVLKSGTEPDEMKESGSNVANQQDQDMRAQQDQ
jgi:hypothetical protein